jgi:hypothetical protein
MGIMRARRSGRCIEVAATGVAGSSPAGGASQNCAMPSGTLIVEAVYRLA